MRNLVLSTTAALSIALASMGMARAQVDLGLGDEATPATGDETVLVAIISKDGAEIARRFFGRNGATVVFPTKDACEAFKQLPFFPQIQQSLDEYVAKEFPGAQGVSTCVPKPE